MADQTRKYRAGSTIFREGEIGDYACLIRAGEVELVKLDKPEAPPLAVLNGGQMFGELALLDGSPRMATARARAETEIIIVDRARFVTKMRSLTPTHRELFDFMASFIRETPVWTKPAFGETRPPLGDKAKRVTMLIPAIENADMLKTGDNFLDVMVKMLVHYAKRRLPPPEAPAA
jgi:hypothetical protein